MSLSDAYKTLSLRPDATASDAKKAYFKKVTMYHPDKLVGKSPKTIREGTEKVTMAKAALDTINKERQK